MRFLLLLLVLSLIQIAKAQGFVRTEYKDSKGTQLRYAILKPLKIKPETKYPLLISLHGSGGRGRKNWEVIVGPMKCFLNRPCAKSIPAISLPPQ